MGGLRTGGSRDSTPDRRSLGQAEGCGAPRKEVYKGVSNWKMCYAMLHPK